MAVDGARKRQFQQQLSQWYHRQGRDLPWRRTTDPYAILVSEVMLQQTQVERVLEYYRRFLEQFPTIEALATAEEAQVLEAWRGLGYYRRARNLRLAAQQVLEHHQGVFPDTYEAIAALPGVGRYTAGAVLSFAFGKRAPILDTNVERVLERVFVRRQTAKASARQKRLWRLAEDILPHGADAWVINQAMMDLGATVCTARGPRCGQCCLQTMCVAAPTFQRQLDLFPYSITAELSQVAEAAAPAYGTGGTPPPAFEAPRPKARRKPPGSSSTEAATS